MPIYSFSKGKKIKSFSSFKKEFIPPFNYASVFLDSMNKKNFIQRTKSGWNEHKKKITSNRKLGKLQQFDVVSNRIWTKKWYVNDRTHVTINLSVENIN